MEIDRIFAICLGGYCEEQESKPSNQAFTEKQKTAKNIKILKKKRYKEAVSDFVSEGVPIIEPESNEEKDKSAS